MFLKLNFFPFKEEDAIRCLPQFDETDEILLPMRQPGEPLPAEVLENFYLLQGSNTNLNKVSSVLQ